MSGHKGHFYFVLQSFYEQPLVEVCQGVAPVDRPVPLLVILKRNISSDLKYDEPRTASSQCLYLDVGVPEGRLAVLSVPVVIENPVRLLLGVHPPGWVPVVNGPVDGPGGQGGDAHGNGDDGGRRQDFPPHSLKGERSGDNFFDKYSLMSCILVRVHFGHMS